MKWTIAIVLGILVSLVFVRFFDTPKPEVRADSAALPSVAVVKPPASRATSRSAPQKSAALAQGEPARDISAEASERTANPEAIKKRDDEERQLREIREATVIH